MFFWVHLFNWRSRASNFTNNSSVEPSWRVHLAKNSLGARKFQLPVLSPENPIKPEEPQMMKLLGTIPWKCPLPVLSSENRSDRKSPKICKRVEISTLLAPFGVIGYSSYNIFIRKSTIARPKKVYRHFLGTSGFIGFSGDKTGSWHFRASRLFFARWTRQDGSNELLFVKFGALDRQLKKVLSKNTSVINRVKAVLRSQKCQKP